MKYSCIRYYAVVNVNVGEKYRSEQNPYLSYLAKFKPESLKIMYGFVLILRICTAFSPELNYSNNSEMNSLLVKQ